MAQPRRLDARRLHEIEDEHEENKKHGDIYMSGEGGDIEDLLNEREALENEKNGAYDERNRVVAALASLVVISGGTAGIRKHEPDPDPDWDDDWKNVVAIDLPTGQVTWHYHDTERHLFEHLPEYHASWDGHTTDEKYKRTGELAKRAGQCDDIFATHKRDITALQMLEMSPRKEIREGLKQLELDTESREHAVDSIMDQLNFDVPRWWRVHIEHYGSFEVFGTEKQASETMRAKAEWEGGSGHIEPLSVRSLLGEIEELKKPSATFSAS